jgi:hypothetical protein
VPHLGILFLFLGQYSLQHIARLGYMREINLGRNALRGAGGLCAGALRAPRATLKMRTHLLRFVGLQRTGMGLAGGQAELCQYVKNPPTLDFHLACEIVDSNLTHPPLFKFCHPKPLVAHSYLMALAALETSLVA